MKLTLLHHTNPLTDETQEIWIDADKIYSIQAYKNISHVRFTGGELLPFDESPDQIIRLIKK